MTIATTTKINKAIAHYGDVKIAKGPGYFYLYGDVVSGAYTTSIPVYSLREQTLEEWISDCNQIILEAIEERRLDALCAEDAADPKWTVQNA